MRTWFDERAVEDSVSVEDPSNWLRNPYALGGDEAWDLRERNGRPSRAVLRLFATGGIGACAVAATVLGAGSAHADVGGDTSTSFSEAPSGTGVPDSGALSFDGGDDVDPPTTPPSAVAGNAGLSPSSPIVWSDRSVPVTGMPDPQGSRTPFAGAGAAVPVAAAQRSSPRPDWTISTVRIGADDELADVTLGGPEQGAMVASLYTEEGRRRVQGLLSNERVVADRDELDRFVADVAGQLRGVAINSTPLTQEKADLFYPVPAPEHPSLVNLPEAMKPGFQNHYDKINTQDAEQAMASRSGFESPELACWIVCHRDGTSRVLPDLYVGGNSYVDGGASTVGQLDLSDVTDAVLVHTHPLFVGADQSYDTTGLSAGDIDFLDATVPELAPHVDPAVASVSVLEGTVTVARRDPVPDGASSSVEDPERGVRGPLRVRVLPSSPGSPVSSDIHIQVDDTGTLDYSLADAMEAPGVSERRYAAAQRAAEVGLDPAALTDPPDLYGTGVVPPEVWTAGGLRTRGLVVRPPVSSIDLPLQAGAADRSVDPDVGGDNGPSSTVPSPSDRNESEVATPTATEETVPAEEGRAATRPDTTGTAPGGSSAGVVVRPDPGLTPEEQADLGLINLPGGWADEPPVELPDLNIPGGPVDPDERDPDELDPNWAQRQKPFVVPEEWGGPETFPDRPDEGMENNIWTFPLPPVDVEQPRVEPTPSPQGATSAPEATFGSPALRPGVPFTAGGVGRSSVAAKDPPVVQRAATLTQPAGITWSSQRASRTYPPPVEGAAAPVTTGFSPVLRAVAPADRAPGGSWAPVSTPRLGPVTEAEGVPAVVDPVRRFTDFVGGAGKAFGENVVAPAGGVVESLVGGPVSVSAVDGDPFTHVGTTRYEASFLGGGAAVYDRESGRKLSGDGPATLPSWQMPVPPGAVLIPLGVVAGEVLKGAGSLFQPQMP